MPALTAVDNGGLCSEGIGKFPVVFLRDITAASWLVELEVAERLRIGAEVGVKDSKSLEAQSTVNGDW